MTETEDELSKRRRLWLRAELAVQDMHERNLALRCRYATGQIRVWLSGARPIRAAVLQELAVALGVEPPAELVEHE